MTITTERVRQLKEPCPFVGLRSGINHGCYRPNGHTGKHKCRCGLYFNRETVTSGKTVVKAG